MPLQDPPRPAVTEAVDAQGHDAPAPSLDAVIPKRRVWPLFVVLALVAALGGFGAWRYLTAPLPLRVLVAIDVDGQWWHGSKAAAAVADALAEQLTTMGFDPVRAGDPETSEILEAAKSTLEAARTLRAAFVIEANVKAAPTALPIEGGFVEIRLDDLLSVRHVAEDRPFFEAKMIGWAGAPTQERAQGYIADQVARQALDLGLPALLEHPSIAEILTSHDAKLIDQLAPAKNFATARASEIEHARAAYADLDAKRKVKERADPPPVIVSPTSADDRMVAAGDRQVLLVAAPVTPYYSPSSRRLLRREDLETIEWRREDRAAEVLWSGYNAFTSPSVSQASGSSPLVAMVEDLYGGARSVTLLRSGDRPRRAHLSVERKLSEPRISPSGKRVSVIDKSCRTCPAEIRVLDVSGAEAREVRFIGTEDYQDVGVPIWLDDERIVLFAWPHGEDVERRDALWSIHVGTAARSALMDPEDGGTWTEPCASPDARKIAIGNVTKGTVVVIDVASLEAKSYEVGGRPGGLAFSPDGMRIAMEIKKGAPENIALLDLQSAVVTLLTDNDTADRHPLFSPDGKRVWFEIHDVDPVFGRKRAVVRVAWVPAR